MKFLDISKKNLNWYQNLSYITLYLIMQPSEKNIKQKIMESENIIVHARSHVIKWINLSEYYNENQRLKNGKRVVTLNFKMIGSKKSIRFGLYTKKQTLNPSTGTFDSIVPGKNQPGLYQSDSSFRITPASILKEKRDTLKEKIKKSNMTPVFPLAEISTRKGLSMEINIEYEDPSHLAMIFENDHHLGKSKAHFVFEIIPVIASEDDSEIDKNNETDIDSSFSVQNTSNFSSALNEKTHIQNGNSFNKGRSEGDFNSPNISTKSRANSSSTLQSESAHNLRRSLGALNKRSFYVNDNSVFQGYVPKNRRNPKSKKQFVTRFFILDMKRATLKYYQNNSSKSIKGEVLLKTCVISSDAQSGEIFIDSGFEVWILKPFKHDYKPWLDALGKCLIEEKLNADKETVFEKYLKLKESSLKIQRLINTTKTITTDDKVIEKLNEMLEYVIIKDHNGNHAELDNTDLYSSLSTEEFYDAIDEIPGIIMITSEDTSEKQSPTNIDNAILEEDDEIINTNDSSSRLNTPLQALNSDTSKLTDIVSNTHPLPHPTVKRRNDVPESQTKPPSLLSFLRKNVGKDMGSISMPVTSNEPLTILQFLAETLEYSSLLNDCLNTFHKKNYDSNEHKRKRLALVSSFALSQLAQQRSKVRCLRKPFNPMLGETFEMVNEIQNYRFIAEKVEHKPQQVFALFTEGFGNNDFNRYKWELSYTVQPSSKFWGKSIELLNYGTIYLRFIDTDAENLVLETYSWSAPITILKNLIAGERYVEPSGEVEVKCIENHLKTTFAFKAAGGFFKGRTEQVNGEMIDNKGNYIGSLDGNWTDSLVLMPENEKIWSVGELVDKSDLKYGFSKFASNLNEISSMEAGMIPISDSRLRPDVRYYEEGDVDKAEELKLKLEQDQRTRRNNNQDVTPSYFKKKADLDYSFIRGSNSYWMKRERQDWSSVPKLW